MRKLIGIFFLLLLLFFFYKLVDQNLINVTKENSIKECNKLNYNQSLFFNSKNFRSFDAKLEIDEWRKWQIISVEDLINYKKFTQFTNRKRVDGRLFILENKNKKCYFQISLRPHGDQKDHRDGNYLPSLQISIKEGNIFGVTNFLLLRPKQRGYSNEIFASHLLRTIGLMAPRTAMVNIEFSSGKYKFLFQEKIRKEFLEFSNKKEGPIFEGDERFVFNLGDVPFVNHRISNSNYVRKGQLNEYMSEKALSIINMYGANHTQSMHRGWVIDYSSMQNEFNRKDFKNLEIFDSIMFAIDALAGLSLQDRRFYYDAIHSKFIPIFYDGIPNLFDKRNRFIEKTIKYKNLTVIDKKVIAFTYPSLFEGKISDSAVRGSTEAIELLNKIDKSNFIKDLDKFGANISSENIEIAILAIISRLEKIEKLNPEKIFDFKNLNNSLYDHYSTKNYSLQNLIFNSPDDEKYEICKIKEEACSTQQKTKLKKYRLLSQEEKLDDKDLIFISKTNNNNLRKGWFHQRNKRGYLKKIQITDDLIVLKSDQGISLEVLEKEKKIYIIKNNMSGRIVFTGKLLEGWDISFLDQTNFEYSNNSEVLKLNDENGLTGCITFYDIKLKNILIEAKNSKCEDSINFLNVSGSIDSIKVENSMSDGVDFDFSNLKINSLISINSKNDCIDFSYGEYLIKNVISENCGDKGLSVGENSNVKVDELISKYSNIGIASKDSSVTEINQAILESIVICFSAYNKKHEFNGAFLNVNNYECNNYDQKFNFDDQSIIKLNNKIMKKT